MNPRLFDQLAAGVSVLILGGLALVSYFAALQAGRMARPSGEAHLRHEPDYFVDGVKILRVNEAGQPALRVQARQLRHYPDTRTLEFDQPSVLTLDENRPALKVTSERGVGPDTGTEARLAGNVVVDREQTADTARLIAKSDAATVYFETNVIETDRPVDIQLGPNHLDGVGMRLDGNARQLQVNARVRGSLAPETSR